MKTFLKYFSIVLFSVFAFLYIYFLFFLPDSLNLNNYKKDIQKAVKENSGLNLEIGDIKLITTPTLGVGAKFEEVYLKLPDNSDFIKIPCMKAVLSVPNLLILNVKLTKVSIYKPLIRTDIINDNKIKPIAAVENFLYNKEKNQNIEDTVKSQGFNPLSLIRINLPDIGIYDYRAYLVDENTKDYILLTGDKISLAYNNGKRFKFKTNSKLYFNKKENITLDINLDSYIPKKEELDEEDDPDVRREMPFINPVKAYKKYDLKTNIKGDIKIDENNIKGFLNAENITINLGGYKIPISWFKFNSKRKNTFINAFICLKENQYIDFTGRFNKIKKTDFDLNLKSNGIYLDNLLSLLTGITDSVGIKTPIPNFKAKGYFKANTNIQMRQNRLKSTGEISFKNGSFINKKLNSGLKDINLTLKLDNDSLNIENSGLKINDGTVKIEGSIDKKSDTNLAVEIDKLPLPLLFSLFATDDIKKQINFKNGYFSANAIVKGRLHKAEYETDAKIEKLSLSDKLNRTVLNNELFEINLQKNKTFYAILINKGLKLIFPYNNSIISNELIKISLNENDIELNPTQFKINKNSAVTLSGAIDDYSKTPEYNFKADGNIFAGELKTLLGNSFAPFIEAKGIIPVFATFKGNKNKQTLKAQICADMSNYITPVSIKQLLNYQTILQLVIDFKGNRIKLKDTGLYSKLGYDNFSDNMALNMSAAAPIVSLDGTITSLHGQLQPMINMLKIKIHKPLETSIIGLKDSKLNLRGNLSIFGNISSPRMRGGFVASNISIPDLLFTMKYVKISFLGKDAEIQTEEFKIDNSDLKISSNLNLNALPLINLYNTKITSDNIDVDSLSSVGLKAASLIPAPPYQAPASDIPFNITSGNFNIKQAKTGNIKADNIRGNFHLNKNVLFVNNLFLNTFKGNLRGRISVNLLNYLININVFGANMDVDEALVTVLNMKDTLTGKLSFKTDLSLRGLEYKEQVNSLNGTVRFLIENGQAGPFSKIENVFLSENLRESEFFKSAMGSIITSAVSVDTSRFKELKGVISFNETGIANINPITMAGGALCLKIAGEMDILNNTLNAKVRGRLGSMVSSVLGPLANINPINIVKATPGLNVAMVKAFSMFCEEVTEEEMNSIPSFSKNKSDFSATKFQIVLNGDANKPLKLLKSFKWLVTKEEYETAEKFAQEIPDDLPENVTTIEELQAYQKYEEESKTFKGKIKHIFKKENQTL